MQKAYFVAITITCVILVFVILNVVAVNYFSFSRTRHEDVDVEKSLYQNAITVLMPTFNRPVDIVETIIKHYEDMRIVDRVIVLEFEGGHKLGHNSSRVSTVTMPNDLRNRFAPHRFPQCSDIEICPAISSPATMTVDDDCMLTERLLAAIYERVLERPKALHGIEGRMILRGEYMPYERPRVKKGGVDVSMLLNWCAMAMTSEMIRVETLFREKYFDLALPLNGEDIAISRLFGQNYMHEFGWVTYMGQPVFNTEISFLTREFSLSSKPNFVKERKKISKNFDSISLMRMRKSTKLTSTAPQAAQRAAVVVSEQKNATLLVLSVMFVVAVSVILHVDRRTRMSL